MAGGALAGLTYEYVFARPEETTEAEA